MRSVQGPVGNQAEQLGRDAGCARLLDDVDPLHLSVTRIPAGEMTGGKADDDLDFTVSHAAALEFAAPGTRSTMTRGGSKES